MIFQVFNRMQTSFPEQELSGKTCLVEDWKRIRGGKEEGLQRRIGRKEEVGGTERVQPGLCGKGEIKYRKAVDRSYRLCWLMRD